MLDERKLAVLRAIVEDYVSTTEPVGSKSLVDRHGLDVSPATIRNDMAVLEAGFIAQPHTSAGRIPTEKGYRLFVDRLSSIKPMSGAERRAIEAFLAGAYSLDEIVARTVRLLAQLTRQVAVVQYPSLSRSAVRHIGSDLLAHPQRVLLVLITDTGRVGQVTVDLPDASEAEWMAHLRAVLNACLDGHKLSDAAATVVGLADRIPAPERSNAGAVFSALLDSLAERHEERVVFGGAANLAAPDFGKGLRDVLEALEEQVVLMRLLGEAASPSALTVRIGAETGLQGASVVTAAYGAGGQVVAKLGVLGPTRMDYPGTMGAVRAVARYVGQILGESSWLRTITRCSACGATPRRMRSSAPTAGWPANCTRTSTRTRRRRRSSRRSTRPTRSSRTPTSARCTTWAATRSPRQARARADSAGSARPASIREFVDAVFGATGQASRGPRSRARRGRNATIRIELDLSECAFGATRELTVDTAVVCPTCSGEGTAPGTHPATCEVCQGRGEISQVRRSFLGQVVTSQPCRTAAATAPCCPGPARSAMATAGSAPGGR